jgi:hypothetical protein
METLAGTVMVAMGAFARPPPKSVTGLLDARGAAASGSKCDGGPGAAAPVALWRGSPPRTPCVGPVLAPIPAFVGAAGNWRGGATAVYLSSALRHCSWPSASAGRPAQMPPEIKSLGCLFIIISGVALLLVVILYLTGHAQIFAVWAQQLPLPSSS